MKKVLALDSNTGINVSIISTKRKNLEEFCILTEIHVGKMVDGKMEGKGVTYLVAKGSNETAYIGSFKNDLKKVMECVLYQMDVYT